ncbi:MAG: 3-phosphoshikimate 1-carboxyvinyltransferase [Candidatus Omnitrophica bacterium]|nr:3-phosphoshikimate 1-carboxyvinyltransferase [Candidatus Omnitrophota bacterium]
MDWTIPGAKNGLKGTITVPADKSISHRAVMFGSIASGNCVVRNFLFGEDCMRTLEAFSKLGVRARLDADTVYIEGRGLRGLTAPSDDLYLGNSGTTMRILSGILAGQGFSTVLTGDESLSERPMNRIIKPLREMGASVKSLGEEDRAPLNIEGRNDPLKAISYTTPVASAQVKSCILAAGLYAEGKTSVTEPFQSRDHTERMLEYFSADIKRTGLLTEITGGRELKARDIDVPGDISSAAFFIVGALVLKGSDITISDVGLNPTRTGLVNVLGRMGASIDILNYREEPEPIGDLHIAHSQLKGTVVEENEVPLMIDEIPILVIASSMAEGTTIIKGIKELKVKETNRVKTLTENLSRMGISIEEKDDELIVNGNANKFKAAELDSFGDHRIAMSMAIAGLLTPEECSVQNVDCVETSYPGFMEDLKELSSE